MENSNPQPTTPADPDKIIESDSQVSAPQEPPIEPVLQEMFNIYLEDPVAAVRSQSFIKPIHAYIGNQLEPRLTQFAKRRGITVVPEAKLLGSTKPKNVDVSVIDPQNGPLVIIGVRSQMSSVANNVLGYYEGIVGECISLQQRFPMASHSYIYLHPYEVTYAGKRPEVIDHPRFARMYAAVTGREGHTYKSQFGIFDHFAYIVADFDESPPSVRDDAWNSTVTHLDMSITTLVDRIINTFKDRLLFWDIFD